MDVDIVYVTYHCNFDELPFFVAVDYKYKKIVVSIRGTVGIEDAITDLNGEIDMFPSIGGRSRTDWLCHRGMLQAAIHLKEKLKELNLIENPSQRDTAWGTNTFGLVIVGHSLGAGTASILGILLKEEYPDLECYCFSPPGGLLSDPVVEYSKTFTTTIVVGEDVVPRIGLRQVENLRADLIHVLKESRDHKLKTLSRSVVQCCCCCSFEHRIPNYNVEEYKKVSIQDSERKQIKTEYF